MSNLTNAVKLLHILTNGRYNIWELAGPRNAPARAKVMSLLLGKKTPQAKSGVNAIQKEFFAQTQIGSGCLAEQEQNFCDACGLIMKEIA